MSSPLSANCRDNIMDSVGHGKLEENSHDSFECIGNVELEKIWVGWVIKIKRCANF